jgi:hypothetical protein
VVWLCDTAKLPLRTPMGRAPGVRSGRPASRVCDILAAGPQAAWRQRRRDPTSPVVLYGKGDHVLGPVAIFGTVASQGANRISSRTRGEAEARATLEAEARPELRRELNFADGFHWDEAPYHHVLGRDIPLAPYVEPRLRAQLARGRTRALAAARALDLRGKAEDAW